MINKISSQLVDYLIKSNVISSEDERAYYKYGIEITVSSILNIILILLCGLILNCLIESLIFLTVFIPIRKYTGGFHAETYFKCNFTFCISYIMMICTYKITYGIVSTHFLFLIVVSCIIIIAFKCPVENENKPLSEEDKKKYRVRAVTLGTMYGFIGFALSVLSNKYGVLILYTLSLVTVLIILVHKEVKENDV